MKTCLVDVVMYGTRDLFDAFGNYTDLRYHLFVECLPLEPCVTPKARCRCNAYGGASAGARNHGGAHQIDLLGSGRGDIWTGVNT